MGGEAKALDVIGDAAKVVRTQQVVPLNVAVKEGPSADSFFVEIFAPRNVAGGGQARFSWFDQNQIPVGSYAASVGEDDFLGLLTIRIPKLEFVGDYRLQADIFSENGWLLATGNTAVQISSGDERMQLSAPILIRKPDGFSLSFDVRNYNLRQTVVPRLQGFFIKNGERQYVLQRKLEPVSLGARQRSTVEFDVEDDFPPGEYYLEAWVESPTGKYLSGVLESYLQLPGNYARLADLEVKFDGQTADRAQILFEGFALVPQGRDLQVFVKSEHDGASLAESSMSVPVVDGYFAERLDVKFPETVNFFSGTMELFSGSDFDLGDSLLTQAFQSPVVEIGGGEIVPQPVLVPSTTKDGAPLNFAPPIPWWEKWWVWLCLALFVCVGMVLLITLTRRKSKRVF